MLSTKPVKAPAHILKLAKKVPAVTMAIAGADHALALDSAIAAHADGLIEPILVGNKRKILKLLKARGIAAEIFSIIDAETEKDCAETAVKLAREGEVTSLMKGHIHTNTLLRAVLSDDFGLKTGARLSHVFHMSVPESDKALLISDAAINIAPDIDTKMHITRNAIAVAHGLGLARPHVAVLSATETASDTMPSSQEAAEIVRRAETGEITGAKIGGPFAFDNAISPNAAALKGITHPVAGAADILIVPNIETGNGLFKMMVYFRSACAAGIVMGAKVPIVLTSRADPAEARLTAAAIAALICAAT